MGEHTFRLVSSCTLHDHDQVHLTALRDPKSGMIYVYVIMDADQVMFWVSTEVKHDQDNMQHGATLPPCLLDIGISGGSREISLNLLLGSLA